MQTEKPKPTEQHKKLEKLVGKWIGEEKIAGSPHAKEDSSFKKNYTLHWFDMFGSPPGAPGTGQWENDALKFHQEGSGNTIFELVEDKYRRAGSRGKVSEEHQPELDRMTSRS